MTGVGQRMPLQQAIILRPGQPPSKVTLQGGQQVRQQVNTQPVPVNSAMPSARGQPIRVPTPSTQTRPLLTEGRKVIINHSGSQISVPLHAVQSLQAGKFSFFAESCKPLSIMNTIYYYRPRNTYWTNWSTYCQNKDGKIPNCQ